MSKRDRPRLAEIPDFQEVRREGTESKVPAAPQNSKVVIKDLDDDDGEDSPSIFHRIGVFCTEYWCKATAFSKSVVSKTWGWCRSITWWTWNGLRKIPSYCVIRWNSDEKTEPTEANTKNDTVKAGTKPESKINVFPAQEQYDEDELVSSRWWSIGIKSAAIAVAVLILAGGYFAVKSFTGSKKSVEIASTEPDGPGAQTTLQEEDGRDQSVVNAPAPQESSLFGDDPFFATSASTPAVPAVAVADDPFGALSTVAAEPLALVAETVPDAPTQTLLALQPLESVRVAEPPRLQPLVALDTPTVTEPLAAEASVSAPVASNYAQRRQARRTTSSPPFSDAPAPPAAANSIPQPVIEQTIPIIRPVKEIVPQIPHSGTIQNVPPPVVEQTIPDTPKPVREIVPQIPFSGTVQDVLPPVIEVLPPHTVSPMETVPVVSKNSPMVAPSAPVTSPAESPPVQPMYPNESVPAIPKDAPVTAAPVVAVQPLPGGLPIDSQLWEQLRELSSGTEVPAGTTEPTKLRFDATPATAEPALRFTPRETAPRQSAPQMVASEMIPQVNEGNLLSGGAADAFKGLLPNELSPHSQDIEAMLSDLENNAPKPVFAEARPAYRSDSSRPVGGEGGVTFRNRQSEMRRSAIRYTVQEGDTVFRLATDKLKDSTRWREILAMNDDRLQDVRDLRPGMEILLPVEAARLNRQTH